jgi:hypothetical protein
MNNHKCRVCGRVCGKKAQSQRHKQGGPVSRYSGEAYHLIESTIQGAEAAGDVVAAFVLALAIASGFVSLAYLLALIVF